ALRQRRRLAGRLAALAFALLCDFAGRDTGRASAFFFAADLLVAAAAGFLSLLSGLLSAPWAASAGFSPLASSAGLASAASSAPARLRLPSWSDLKSVSYQPPPFRRNTGADTSFLSVCFLQLGHCFSGGSEII